MKKLILICAALFTMTAMHAQSEPDEFEFGDGGTGFVKTKNNAFYVGPKVGATISTMTDPEEGKLADGAGAGVSAGVGFKARFGKASANSIGGTGFVGVGLELKYTLNSVKTKASNEKGKSNAALSLSYLDIPVYAQVFPLAKVKGANSLYIEAGVKFGILMGCGPKTLTFEQSDGNVSKAVYHINDGDSKLKGGDISPLIGLGYTVPGTGLDVNARYKIGTSKLAGNFPCKVSSFEVSLAWYFNAGKF